MKNCMWLHVNGTCYLGKGCKCKIKEIADSFPKTEEELAAFFKEHKDYVVDHNKIDPMKILKMTDPNSYEIHHCKYCNAWSGSAETIGKHLKKCEAKKRIEEKELEYKNKPWMK